MLGLRGGLPGPREPCGSCVFPWGKSALGGGAEELGTGIAASRVPPGGLGCSLSPTDGGAAVKVPRVCSSESPGPGAREILLFLGREDLSKPRTFCEFRLVGRSEIVAGEARFSLPASSALRSPCGGRPSPALGAAGGMERGAREPREPSGGRVGVCSLLRPGAFSEVSAARRRNEGSVLLASHCPVRGAEFGAVSGLCSLVPDFGISVRGGTWTGPTSSSVGERGRQDWVVGRAPACGLPFGWGSLGGRWGLSQ